MFESGRCPKLHVVNLMMIHRWLAAGMGFTFVNVKLSKRIGGESKPLRLLVDTGAFYTMIPRGVLARIGIKPFEKRSLQLADGRVIERDVGIVFMRYGRRSTATPVVFGERGDASVLGVLALEGLTLEVDPRTQRLKEMKVIPMYVEAAAST